MMCGSNGFSGACCPPAQILKEEICGNFNGPLTAEAVWSAPIGGYVSGTFQIFNSASSPATVTAAGTSTPAIALSADPGNTDSQSVNNPTDFSITAGEGDSGTYCITLYKRVLA
ncbi:S-Ena type endospore appendage [Virgibacillus pantothenticus]|uniref:S-Ena type endospore appendage n=1 Tax=Virgibacillus pantothenticus TaxID=1473 RepID=UPI002014DDF1|nr:S-Ena type endospore appendage [Virgibacillus pantothenticus]